MDWFPGHICSFHRVFQESPWSVAVSWRGMAAERGKDSEANPGQKAEFEQAPGIGDGQGSLECCSPWGRKELDMTEWLNRTEWCKQQIFISHKFGSWKVDNQGACQVCSLWEFSSWHADSCPFLVSSHGRKRARALFSLPLLVRIPIPPWGSHPTSCKFNPHPPTKPHLQVPSCLGVRATTYECGCGGTDIQSIILCLFACRMNDSFNNKV